MVPSRRLKPRSAHTRSAQRGPTGGTLRYDAIASISFFGFDHGAGHPLLFLDDPKAPNYRKNKGFKGLGNYSEWPKVAGAVIKADFWILPQKSNFATEPKTALVPR
jgi:hypothetical protein